jgi:hypothetical protein
MSHHRHHRHKDRRELRQGFGRLYRALVEIRDELRRQPQRTQRTAEPRAKPSVRELAERAREFAATFQPPAGTEIVIGPQPGCCCLDLTQAEVDSAASSAFQEPDPDILPLFKTEQLDAEIARR